MSNMNTQTASGLAMYAVRFTANPLPGAETIAKFQQPAPLVAGSTAMAGLPQDSRESPDDGFHLIAVSPADQAGQQQAQAWIQGSVLRTPSVSAGSVADDSEPAIRQNIDGGWVLYRPGRAVICAAEPAVRDLRVALADVQFHDWQLRKLEAEVAKDWDTAQSHIPLTHQANLKRSGTIKALTQDTLSRRMRCARIERPLLTPTTPMSEPARKLAYKLRDALDIEDRLDTLDGQIEVYEDLCELANQRQSDYSHFLREFIVEILIVVLLMAEVVLVSFEIWISMNGE
jgi:hypothetical protein